MKKVTITYGGTDKQGADCENALSFNVYGDIDLEGIEKTEKKLRKSCFENMAIAHGILYGLHNVKVKCVSIFEEKEI